jgi:hypothetical protein
MIGDRRGQNLLGPFAASKVRIFSGPDLAFQSGVAWGLDSTPAGSLPIEQLRRRVVADGRTLSGL